MAALLELLVKVQLLDERQQVAVQSRARSPAGGHLIQQIAERGWATEGSIARALSVELGLPRLDVQQTPPEGNALALLDAGFCAERFVLPVALREGDELLWLALADPTDQEAIAVVRRRTRKRVRPAVATPTEILRAVRTCYAAAGAGLEQQPEVPPPEKLRPIELAEEAASQPFEVVQVGEDLSAVSRLAGQLGVEVPANLPSRLRRPAPVQVRLASPAQEAAPSGTDPRLRAVRGVDSLEALFRPVRIRELSGNDLGPEDAATLEALRASLERGARVLRAVAQLCVEKGLIDRDELSRRGGRRR